jgi:hypothetical protein
MKGVDKTVDTFNAASENKIYSIFNTFMLVLAFGNKYSFVS